ERPVDVFDAARVVLRADSVFSDVDRHSDPRARIPHTLLERLGPEFISHLSELHSLLGPQVPALSDPPARVRLDAEEVAPIRRREPWVVYFRALPVAFAFEADSLLILHGD